MQVSQTQHDDVEIIQSPKVKNIKVIEDKNRNLVVLQIYGTIEEPEEYIEELNRLNILSFDFDVIEITLNSPGGSLNTTVDLFAAIKNFKYIITIGKGEIASAAFMLWTLGDLKVVTDYSMYMAHRESYGMYGKTTEHRDTAKTYGVVYEELFQNCFGQLLTKKEMKIAERSEVWISYKDLLTRSNVINYETYTNPPNPYSVSEIYNTNDGLFVFDDSIDKFRKCEILFGESTITDLTEYLYGLSDLGKIKKKCKIKNKKKGK